MYVTAKEIQLKKEKSAESGFILCVHVKFVFAFLKVYIKMKSTNFPLFLQV